MNLMYLQNTINHFWKRLWETPLLLGWLVLGPFIALWLNGWTGLLTGVLNLFLLGVFALLIRRFTPDPAAPHKIRRPRLELTVGLILFALFFMTQLLDFDVWTIEPLHLWVRTFFVHIYRFIEGIRIVPGWMKLDLYLAASSTVKMLIPTLLAFWILGCSRTKMGLSHPDWKLSAVLVSITAAAGLVTGFLFHVPLFQIPAFYIIGIFINALPEELFFRGFLLPRLEKFFSNPLNALVVSALFFNAIHIPIEVNNGASILEAASGIFSIGYPTGLIWGYLYLRTRSIIPGTLWHAANGVLGFVMMNL